MRYLRLFFIGKFIIYTYCIVLILTLYLSYICVCIDMFVHNKISALICLCVLYNIIIGCDSSWKFCYISLLCMGYFTTALSLHMHLNKYFCEYYKYVYCNMFVYFEQRTPCLGSIFGSLLCIFPYLFSHF